MLQNDMQGAREANAADLQHNKARAAAASTAASTATAAENSAPIGPATQVTWISPPFTPKVSGRVKIIATLFVNDVTVDDPVSYQLVRDPVAATGAPGGTLIGSVVKQDAGHTSGDATVTLTWIDVVAPPFVAHTWGITGLSAAGHNLTVATAGATTVLEELPA